MITQRAALHVAYYIATGRETPGPSLTQTSPESVLKEVTDLGHASTFEAAKAPDIVAEYKANGVVSAATLLRSQTRPGA